MKKKLLVLLLCLLCSGLFAKVYYTESYDSIPKLIENFNYKYKIDLEKYEWKIVTETYYEYDILTDSFIYKEYYRIVFVADFGEDLR